MVGVETTVSTPINIFNLPQHLIVPLFQRPYVWNEQDQWAPLWSDIRRLTEVRLADPVSTATHFLGAIVVQASEGRIGSLAQSSIIDGQQRLTTLQLLMDATAAVLKEADLDLLAGQLDSLTHNQANFLRPGESALKLRHSNKDRDAFDEVMEAEPPVDHGSLTHAGALIVRAHAFFATAVTEWLGDVDGDGFVGRAEGLVSTLIGGLQLVAINLRATENSQEIFETLNARGTPLTASDLVRNFVFQRLNAEGTDTAKAYAELWPFETKFWEKEISVGRYLVSRSSLFLNQWLVARLGEEVGPQQTFTRFKALVEHGALRMSDLLPVIQRQANLYRDWTIAAEDPDRQLSRLEMSVYRMRACDVEVLKPLLIWLYSPERAIPTEVADQVVAVSESWVMRRLIMRLDAGNLGRVVEEIIRVFDATPASELVAGVTAYLGRLGVASTYWPGDEEIRACLASENVYKSYRRGRIRVLLEAVEDAYRTQTRQPQVSRRGYPIEHIMPQTWETDWPVEGDLARLHRAEHIHRLGNLTLLTPALNSKVSNRSWALKQEKLRRHDVLLLNSRLLAESGPVWDEDLIDARTAALVDVLLSVWPVPEGHVGAVADARARAVSATTVRDLIVSGHVAPGTVLTARAGAWTDRRATVRADGTIEVDGKVFESLSSAGKFVKGGVTNGWNFWRLPDGRRMLDARAAFWG
jgi:hypothetical protein